MTPQSLERLHRKRENNGSADFYKNKPSGCETVSKGKAAVDLLCFIPSRPVMNNKCRVSVGIKQGVGDVLFLSHALVNAASTQFHNACRLGPVCCLCTQCVLIPVFMAGMLTITDFIIILHRYYKSPMVGPIHRYASLRPLRISVYF